MIQRIQTFYLALIAAICFTVASVKLYELIPGETAKNTKTYTATVWKILASEKGQDIVVSNAPYLGFILLAIGFISLITAWKFKARKMQMNLCKLMLLLSLAWFGFFLSGVNTLRVIIGTGYKFNVYPFTAIVIVLPILILLAFRGIKKDDELVRSADRLR